MRRSILLIAALVACPTVYAECGPIPPPPPQTDAWAVRVSDTEWRTEVPGWVKAPEPACWVLGRVELKYEGDAETPGVDEPTPWVEGLDFPEGSPCPAEAVAGCWKQPYPWVSP